jgi:hypothetical protein
MDEHTAVHIKELTKARNAVERQIDILTNCRPEYGINRKAQITDVLNRLHDTLRELEECIRAETGDSKATS